MVDRGLGAWKMMIRDYGVDLIDPQNYTLLLSEKDAAKVDQLLQNYESAFDRYIEYLHRDDVPTDYLVMSKSIVAHYVYDQAPPQYPPFIGLK